MQQNLKGVPETMLIPLWARAVESQQSDPIIRDDKAVEMMAQIDFDFAKFDGAWMSQTGVVIRTELLDRATRAFIQKHPDAVIINIGCGLDTRFSRMDNGEIRWCDLDLPETMLIRQRFFEETDRYQMIAKSVFDYSWARNIKETKEPILIIAEGIFMYFTEQEVHDLMNKLLALFPRVDMLFEMMTPAIVKSSKRHDTVSKTSASFKWGIKSGREMEAINARIHFVDEWNYFDYHPERWRNLRWLAMLPAFKNNFNNRIVQLCWHEK